MFNTIRSTKNKNNLSEEEIIKLASEINNGIRNLGIYKETDFYDEKENEIQDLYIELKELVNKYPNNINLQEIMADSFIDYLERIYVNDIKFDNKRLEILNDFKEYSAKYFENKNIQLKYLKAIKHTLSKLRYQEKGTTNQKYP